MKRVLIVDNHDLFRQVLAVVLGQYTDLKESLQAHSLSEARRILGGLDGRIDLAIIDLDISDGSGTELVKELRDAQPDVPVLAITVGRSLQLRAQALQAGADQVLSTAAPGEKIVRAAELLVGG
jgi:two-component system, NarL family, response regulator DevR